MPAMSEPILDIRELHVWYGQIHALKGASLTLGAGEVVALIGGNGAGKSTLLRAISGLIRPREGEILLRGCSLVGLPAHEVVGRGLSHAPEGRKVFTALSVEENLAMGAWVLGGDRTRIDRQRERVFSLFPRLLERRRQLAGTLSGGEQQMLAIGRALMAEPQVLLLDEPSLGLAPILVERIFATVREIHRAGVSILLVEQNARGALALADRAYVLETGRVALSGAAADLLVDERVRKAYLGEG
jgi:branched-chain amino acid transport system ATP-binding protein